MEKMKERGKHKKIGPVEYERLNNELRRDTDIA